MQHSKGDSHSDPSIMSHSHT